jgi:methylenetetrahydrofolate dehydrogenase (NADP+)/methenyltetrahydrofolate cyclohydrolase/formyltetrahydrofolate synthetase
MNRDLDIARSVTPRRIADVAADLGLTRDELIFFGDTQAKVRLSAYANRSAMPNGTYVDVTAITPTPLGEGKTTTTVGLVQSLARRGKRAVACIRQPSQGPTFGIKGGAAGGGHAQVVPMEDLNLHLTGDFHAITAAHNLIAAALDARLLHERDFSDQGLAARGLTRLRIDPHSIVWRRVVDTCDRALRNVVMGLGARGDGVPRQSGFEITAASELMACLALADDLFDLRRRVGRIIVAYNTDGEPVTTEDLGVAGAATVLMKDTVNPTLLQTLEGQGVFVHAGPFANIAHGNSSIIADRIALKVADLVVTESGFGSDIGMEKFFDIKCRTSGLVPDVVVMVATIRALKMHGGGPRVLPGKPLPEPYAREDLGLLEAGLPNLMRHLEIARKFGVPVVVAVNPFPGDTRRELERLRRAAHEAGAVAAVADHWARGGEGALELADAVIDAATKPKAFRFLYPLDVPLRQKIETLACEIYGADGVEYSEAAQRDIERCERLGYGRLPVCMAKTHLSLSHDPSLKGAPTGFTLPIREVRISAGAGFVYPLCGEMQTMPGLPAHPVFMDIDIDAQGEPRGIS